MRLTYRTITAADALAFDALLAIYEASIDTSEQKPAALLRRQSLRSDYVFLAGLAGGEVAAFAICYAPACQGFWLLEYLAVSQAARSGGLGAKVFRKCLRHFADRPHAVLEVDAPEPHAPGAETRARRLAFYKRLGCRIVAGLRYELPLKVAGHSPPPMVLLTHSPRTTKRIRQTLVRNWLTRIYVDVYAKRPTDPRIARMLHGLPGEIALEPIAAT